MHSVEYNHIPYVEYRAIGTLLRAHIDSYGENLRAMVAFGELVTSGLTLDIDLLEVVEGWQGGRLGEFGASTELPLRGRLRLFFVTPEEFEDPSVIPDLAERPWVEDLLRRVGQGYEIVMEAPPGYARRVLERHGGASTLTPPPSGYVVSPDPFKPSARGK